MVRYGNSIAVVLGHPFCLAGVGHPPIIVKAGGRAARSRPHLGYPQCPQGHEIWSLGPSSHAASSFSLGWKMVGPFGLGRMTFASSRIFSS